MKPTVDGFPKYLTNNRYFPDTLLTSAYSPQAHPKQIWCCLIDLVSRYWFNFDSFSLAIPDFCSNPVQNQRFSADLGTNIYIFF